MIKFIVPILFLIIAISGLPGCKKKHDQALKPAELYHYYRNYPDFEAGHGMYLRELAKISGEQHSINKSGEIPQWVTQGPYNHGGRINTIAHNPGNDQIIYAGGSNGGVFKTINGGKNWFPIFDAHSYLAIGHIMVSTHDTNIVYAGTGDPNISGYPWVGDGLYKSSDAGNSWQHLGLDSVGIISKIVEHPNNPNIMYVATMGIPFKRDANRGLFKTIDGGKNWQKVLYLANNAGIIDLVQLINSPDTLFAAGWNRIRNYNESIAVGAKSKVYRTFNGGITWDTLTNGLPEKDMSRVGLAVVNNDSSTLIAQFVGSNYEMEGLYSSNNMGDSWEKLSSSGLAANALGGFGWYFGKIRSNPFDPSQLFVLGVGLWQSANMGNTFVGNQGNIIGGAVHADKHDMAFIDTNTFLLATDGGLYKTTDGGQTWEDIENIANTQFYRVAVDHHNSGFYCGGAQDNGTIYGSFSDSANWTRLLGGDGFQAIFDFENPQRLYAETQKGMVYTGVRSGSDISWDYLVNGFDEDNRPWDMPLCMSKTNSNILFAGVRSIYKNSNASSGVWEKISHDITDGTNQTFHFVSSIDVSPFTDEVVTAGTSNGHVYVLDQGVWKNISTGLPNRYVSDVFNSYDNETGLFVSHTGYKEGEYIPHIHYSGDLGNTWYDISGNMPQISVNALFVLPNYNDSVIFAATDGGVYHTLNRGEHWERTGSGMPIVPVYDLAYDDTNHVLVAGTFGRSILGIQLKQIAQKRDSLYVVSVQSIVEYAQVYPNPANRAINISVKNEGIIRAKLFNSSGQLVLSSKLNNDVTQIDVSLLSPGLYLLVIDGQLVEKVFIDR